MLAHVLALAVGLGSFTLYMAAFFFPEVHRKHDFFWSGLGLFYALVLWTAAGQITGAVLLGQTTSVALLGWLGWQTLVLRRVKTPLDLQTPATAQSWRDFQEEMTSLFQDFAAQTPIGRFLGINRRTATAAGAGQVKIRASSIREVGYEFLDDLEETVEPVRGVKTAAQDALQKAAPPQPNPQPSAVPSPVSVPAARTRPARPPKPAPSEKTASAPRSPSVPGQVPIPTRTKGAVGQALAKVIVLKDWAVDLVGSVSRPKPSKPVIEIPPREPSIPLSKKASLRKTAPVAVEALDLEDDNFWDEGAESTAPGSDATADSAALEETPPVLAEPEPEPPVETPALSEDPEPPEEQA